MPIYYLAIEYESGKWSLKEYSDTDEIINDICLGETHGCNFKIFKELLLEINE